MLEAAALAAQGLQAFWAGIVYDSGILQKIAE